MKQDISRKMGLCRCPLKQMESPGFASPTFYGPSGSTLAKNLFTAVEEDRSPEALNVAGIT